MWQQPIADYLLAELIIGAGVVCTMAALAFILTFEKGVVRFKRE